MTNLKGYMQKLIIGLCIIAGIAISIFIATNSEMQKLLFINRNASKIVTGQTKLTFSKAALFPPKLGNADTSVFKFNIRTKGPNQIVFDENSKIGANFVIKNASSKNSIPGGKSCALKNAENPSITYATIADWTIASDGPGVSTNKQEVNTTHFSNFGEGSNQKLIIEPNTSTTLLITCDTTGFSNDHGASTFKAGLATPESVWYKYGISDGAELSKTGNSEIISGLPIEGPILRTAL